MRRRQGDVADFFGAMSQPMRSNLAAFSQIRTHPQVDDCANCAAELIATWRKSQNSSSSARCVGEHPARRLGMRGARKRRPGLCALGDPLRQGFVRCRRRPAYKPPSDRGRRCTEPVRTERTGVQTSARTGSPVHKVRPFAPSVPSRMRKPSQSSRSVCTPGTSCRETVMSPAGPCTEIGEKRARQGARATKKRTRPAGGHLPQRQEAEYPTCGGDVKQVCKRVTNAASQEPARDRQRYNTMSGSST